MPGSRTSPAPSASPRTSWSPTSTCCPCAAPASAAATCSTSTPTASASGGTTRRPRRGSRAAAARRRRGHRAARGGPRRVHPARLRESDRQALLRATAKVETAAGRGGGRQLPAAVTFESEGGVFADVDRAISERRRLWIRYYSPRATRSPSARSTRSAWSASATPTSRPGAAARRRAAPSGSTGSPRSESWTSRRRRRSRAAGPVRGAGAARGRGPRGRRRGQPGGRWVAEYYPHDSADELPDGGLRITLRTPDPASLRRLALRLGRDGRIVSPPELADSARQAAREALAAYDGVEA